MSTRILIADDHKIVREGLRSLLDAEPNMAVIAEAADGRTALELVEQQSPDVVVMDIGMPDLNGIDATRKIKAANQHVKVIALSMHSDRRFVGSMLQAGASAYLLKDCAVEELARAIHAVLENRFYLSSGITSTVVEDYVRQLSTTDSSPASALTAKEREVLQLLAEGWTTKKTALRLHVSVKTIETHRLRIMDKLDIHSLPELTKFAIREGLTTLEG